MHDASNEHIPPKLIFKSCVNDSITVPSCGEHNGGKSQSDQTAVYAMMIAMLEQNDKSTMSPVVRRAIEDVRSSMGQVRRRTRPAQMVSDLPGLSDVAYHDSQVELYDWVRHVAAGLVYDVTGDFDDRLSWDSANVVCPQFVSHEETAMPATEALQHLLTLQEITSSYVNSKTWHSGWSARPRPYPSELFNFWFAVEASIIVLWLRFLSSFSFFVGFSAPESVRGQLLRRSSCIALSVPNG